MSEFFKALEQAERDRQLAERDEETATASEVEARAAAGGAEPAHPPAVTPPGSHTAGPAAPAASVAAPIGPSPVAPVPAPSPLQARPAEGRRLSVFSRPTDATAPPVARSVPPAVEHPVSPFERPAPAAGRPAAPERQLSRPEGRPGPVRVERATPRDVDAPVEPDAAPLQGAIKRSKGGPVLITDLDPRSVAAEAYRTLRANLEFMPSERGCRMLAITSASMGEGKSTTAANLAVVAAQAGSRVCLVDADMRRPMMHKLFGFPNQGGFTRALSQAMPLSSVAVQTVIPNLSLVVAGSADGLRPAQLLNAPRLQKVLHDPGTPFDLVLFDTPPIISVADAMNLAPQCDGVVLVVRSGAVPPSVLQQAVRQMNQVNAKVLGVLLNHVDLRRGEAEFYRYYRAYYSPGRNT